MQSNIVAKQGVSEDVAKSNPIAVPGLKTSAYLGIRLCWGDLEYEVVPFDEIIPRILDDTTNLASLSMKVN